MAFFVDSRANRAYELKVHLSAHILGSFCKLGASKHARLLSDSYDECVETRSQVVDGSYLAYVTFVLSGPQILRGTVASKLPWYTFLEDSSLFDYQIVSTK